MKFIYLFLLFPLICQAVPVKELQELRLAKAELAISEGNDKRAMQYIAQNLNQKEFHLQTFIFLMEYYQNKKQYTKSLRVARYLIKKTHSRAFLNMSQLEEIQEIAFKIPTPSQESLLLYFKLGQLFYRMWQSKNFNEEYHQKLLGMSLKYFSICDHYQFVPAQTKYYLAILQREVKQHHEAIKHLVELQDLIDDENHKEEVNFLLGDSLIREGYTDAGSIYLRSVQTSSQRHSEIKEYASNYLDTLSQRNNYFSMALNYSTYQDSNIHDFNSEQLDDFASYESVYLRKKASMKQYGFDSIASFMLGKYWRLKITGDFSENKAKQRDLYFADFRDWGVRADLKYFNLIKSQVKLTYSFSNHQKKTPGNHAFFDFSNTHLIQLQYTHTLKAGMLTYGIPISFAQYPQYTNTSSYGAYLSYSQFRLSPLWSPSYTALISNSGEYEPGISNSLQISATISNYMSFTNDISNFAWIRLLQNQNQSESHSYTLLSLNNSLILIAPFTNKLTMNLGASYQFMTYQDSTSFSNLILSAKFSYLFD